MTPNWELLLSTIKMEGTNFLGIKLRQIISVSVSGSVLKVSEAAWLRLQTGLRLPGSVLQNVWGCLAPSYRTSEAAWLRPTERPRLPGSVLKMSEAAWLRLKVKTSPFPWQPVGILKFQLREVALHPKDLCHAKSCYDPSKNQGGVSGQTFSVSEDAWLRLLSNYSKMTV